MEKKDLKFRVWNGSEMEHNIMVGKFGIFYVNPSNNGIDENDTASLSPFNTRYPDDIPLMRFAGRKDKNEIDIYEGDIVRHWEYFLDENFKTKEIAEDEMISRVYWSDELNGWALSKDHKREIPMAHRDLFEIVGNIYQNPTGFAEAGGKN